MQPILELGTLKQELDHEPNLEQAVMNGLGLETVMIIVIHS